MTSYFRKQRQSEGRSRRAMSAAEFPEAARVAAERGLRLIRHDDAHYALRKDGAWLLNLYPGNQRLYYDRAWPQKPPYLHVPSPWSLLDCVRAASGEEIEGADDEPGRKNYDVACEVCGQVPTVGDTGLCGPCCFGEADTMGGNW